MGIECDDCGLNAVAIVQLSYSVIEPLNTSDSAQSKQQKIKFFLVGEFHAKQHFFENF